MRPPSIKLKMHIAITILPLLLFYTEQTSANDEVKYGLGGYQMDGKEQDKQQMMVPEYALLLKTAVDVKSYKTNDHTDKQFKPCKVELDKDNEFEVFYDQDAANEGCTVDFVMKKKDKITTHIRLADKKMACLEDCGSGELVASSKNLVPFTYSLSNDEFKTLHEGPPYIKDQTCDEKACANKGGKCMASATSLQLAWNKCAKVRARAWIQLVGDPVSAWSAKIEDKPEENPDVTDFELSIEIGDNPKFPGKNVPLFTVKGPEGIVEKFLHKISGGANIYPACFFDDKLPMIPVPQFWTIKSGNPELNDKYLLVFHFLPQAATRTFAKNGILQNGKSPGAGLPKCRGKLSIIFHNVGGLLQSSRMPPPTTISTTTGIGSSDGTMEPNATTEPEEAMSIGSMLAIVGGVLLLLIVVAVLMWFFFCRDKEKVDDDDDDDEAEEEKEEEKKEEDNDKSNPYKLREMAVLV